jgi:hypothetical protein
MSIQISLACLSEASQHCDLLSLLSCLHAASLFRRSPELSAERGIGKNVVVTRRSNPTPTTHVSTEGKSALGHRRPGCVQDNGCLRACDVRPAIFAVALILSGCSSSGCTGPNGWIDSDNARCNSNAVTFPVYSVPTWIPGGRY